MEPVLEVLRHFRDETSPGVGGIPIVVWKSLPELVFKAVADLLRRVEAVGKWPDESIRDHDSQSFLGHPPTRSAPHYLSCSVFWRA